MHAFLQLLCRYFEASTTFVFERGYFELYLINMERCAVSSHAQEDIGLLLRKEIYPEAAVISRQTVLRCLKKWMVARDLSRFEPGFKLRDFCDDQVLICKTMGPLLPKLQEWFESRAKKDHSEYCPLGHGGKSCALVLDGCAKIVCNMCPFHSAMLTWNPEGRHFACLYLI